MMPRYLHRQIATPILVALGFALVGTIAAMVAVPEARLWMTVVLVTLVIVGMVSGTLTTSVDNHSIRVAFGSGFIRRTFALSSVKRATAVRNKWYYGWGIRLTPHGWMFNVSGLDAVEVEFMNGRKFRIGTDDPQGLQNAIDGAIPRATPPR
jgi:hypothetical protein